MAALCAVHERLGHGDVKHYIQSGNVVFGARGTAGEIAKKLAAEFAEEFGFAARVMVVDAWQLVEIALANPYGAAVRESAKSVHVGICDGEPKGAALEALLAKTAGREKFSVGKRVIYLHVPEGYGPSKFAAGMERACGAAMTLRNWRTVEAILGMISGRR